MLMMVKFMNNGHVSEFIIAHDWYYKTVIIGIIKLSVSGLVAES